MQKAKEYFDKEYGPDHIKEVVDMGDMVSIYGLMEEYAEKCSLLHSSESVCPIPEHHEIVFDEFNQWVYNDENQAGEKMQVIDAADLPQIIQNVVKKYNDIHNVARQSEQLVCDEKLFDQQHGSY